MKAIKPAARRIAHNPRPVAFFTRPVAFATLALALAATGRLRAAEVTWKSSVAEGNWNDASSWEGGSVPGENDTAKFSSSPTVTINTSGNTYCYIASIAIDEGATVTFKGSGNETNPARFASAGTSQEAENSGSRAV